MKTIALTTMTIGAMFTLASCGSGSGSGADVDHGAMVPQPPYEVQDQGKKKGK